MSYSDGRSKNPLMAGFPQVALFAGEKAKGADLAALERAKALKNQGLDPWLEGWFQDETGWSFEIDDTGYAEQGNALMPVHGRVITRPYGQTYTHPELSRYYPDFMSRSRVTVDPDLARREDVDGMVTEGDRVWVDPLLPSDNRLLTGLHETQHALDNYEGRRRFQSRDYLQDPREQRAFNVEYRRGLTPEQRRKLSPGATLPAALKAYTDKD
jgi:hypothetical protein